MGYGVVRPVRSSFCVRRLALITKMTLYVTEFERKQNLRRHLQENPVFGSPIGPKAMFVSTNMHVPNTGFHKTKRVEADFYMISHQPRISRRQKLKKQTHPNRSHFHVLDDRGAVATCAIRRVKVRISLQNARVPSFFIR